MHVFAWPQMSRYGAYGPDKVYTREDLQDLALYAYYRGVRLVPEIDSPSHVAYGWEWGPSEGLGDLLLCKLTVNVDPDCFGPPCGYLNPLNQNVYRILKDIFEETVDNFLQPDLFHVGADEVIFHCWNQTDQIVQSLESQGFTTLNDTGFFEVPI